MPADEQLAGSIERINRLIEHIENLGDPVVQEQMQELLHCVLEYHCAAVERLVGLLTALPQRNEVLGAIAEDELIGSLLLLHDCHPETFEERVAGAIADVRPFLASHGGNVELAGIVDGVVHLRLTGNCHGCPSSRATLKSRVEQAIHDAAPETAGIELDEGQAHRSANGFVALEELTTG